MDIPVFDYDAYWRDGDGVRDSTAWRDQGLHWHGYLWRGGAADYGDEPARRDLGTELPPKLLADWLRKPARTVRTTATTPEEMAEWLRNEWRKARSQLGPDATAIDETSRFGRALHDLRRGQPVCWGGWLGPSTFWHVAAIPTAAACHEATTAPDTAGRPWRPRPAP